MNSKMSKGLECKKATLLKAWSRVQIEKDASEKMACSMKSELDLLKSTEKANLETVRARSIAPFNRSYDIDYRSPT
jgi:hypothetical protein